VGDRSVSPKSAPPTRDPKPRSSTAVLSADPREGRINSQTDEVRGWPIAAQTVYVAASAAWVVETYPCTVREERPDGSYVIEIVSNSEHWLGRLLLRAGGAITVVAPAEMAAVQARTANAVLASYRANS
jgi:predicted DNA-binding transcriptional regulator YafY